MPRAARNELSAEGPGHTANGRAPKAGAAWASLLSSCAELSRVLHDERTRLRVDPVEEAIGDLALVEYHEQSGAGSVQPAESRVRRPRTRLVVVLDERLHENARR